MTNRVRRILLVEDNPGDVVLVQEALGSLAASMQLQVAPDGIEALRMLRAEGEHAGEPRPDLILLDLNLPRMDGRELLGVLKRDPVLKRIPVVILTTSRAEEDILRSYDLHANCYITKPVSLDQIVRVVRSIESFWLGIVSLPEQEGV